MFLKIIGWLPWSYISIFLIGMMFMCLIQGVLIYYWLLSSNSSNHNFSSIPSVNSHTFPQQLLDIITDRIGDNSTEGTVLLNLLLQFWFQENRYNISTLTAIGNKLNTELTELLSNTPLGKLFSSLKIHDIELGSESPTVSAVCLKSININKEQCTLNSFVFEFDINYVGGFYMSIDAAMKFNNNTAFVAIKVNKCVGRIHVEFTRLPYTYWSLSFVQQPELELIVESRLEGHSVPQLNKIIGIQIRRRINRKFVLPYYKIRSKPFLPTYNINLFKDDESQPVPSGILHITLLSLSRLPSLKDDVYCTLSVDNDCWIEDAQLPAAQTHILHLFKRPNKELSPSPDLRKYSTGSVLQDRYQEGLRQRFHSITGHDNTPVDDVIRRNSSVDPGVLSKNSSESCLDKADCVDIQSTKHLPCSELLVFNENFKFIIEPTTSRYLNILVWNRTGENGNDNLVGFVSLPLATQICLAGIGRKHRVFYLQPSVNTRNAVSYQSLCTHPGFNPSLCYGDVCIAIKFVSSSSPSPSKVSPTKVGVKKSSPTLTYSGLPPDIDQELSSAIHQFDKIIITKPVICDFCSKKIWWKDAFKCSKCSYVCHKKCILKCENNECIVAATDASEQLLCGEDALNLLSSSASATVNPEIITTTPDNNVQKIPTGVPMKNKFSTFFANVKGVRRVGSTSNLAPPTQLADDQNHSHSLPQTPGQSPSISRKASMCTDGTLFRSVKCDGEVEKALSYLLSMPHNEQMLESVKSSGKKLCVDLLPSEREIRINEMISSIKTRIDIESDKYNELITSKERQQQPSDGAEAAKIAFQIGKCEETLQALTNLLLHCCSGLQDSQQSLETAEDTEEQQLSSERHTIASSEDVEEDATTTTADRQPETEDLLSAVTLSNGISENADQLTADCC